MENPAKIFQSLAWYFATVLIGLAIHSMVVLPVIYGVITRSLPFGFIKNMGNALATAFGTASSSATLPVTMDALEQKNKIDPRISRFVLPIGKFEFNQFSRQEIRFPNILTCGSFCAM